MKIKTIQDLSNVETWEELRRYTSQAVKDLTGVVNGGISLVDNTDAQEVSITFTGAGIEARAAHTLGRIPVRYIVTSNDIGIVPYNGVTANTADSFYLRATGAGALKILLE